MLSPRDERRLLPIFTWVWRQLSRYNGHATAVLFAFVALNFVIQRRWNWDAGFIGFELIFAALTLVLPSLTITIVAWVRGLSSPISRIAGLSEEAAAVWVDNQIRELFARWAPVVCGLLLVLIGVLSTVLFWVPWRGWIGALFFVWAGIFFFGYGALAWAFGALLVLVWRIGELPIHCSPFRWPTNQIYAVYQTYFRLLVIGASLYGLAVSSVWISPGGSDIALGTGLGMLWVFPPAACIIVFFLTFHFRIHTLLLRCKQASDEELTGLLDSEYKQWLHSQDVERAERIHGLLEWRDNIRQSDEWPLGLRSVLLTITTLLLPTIKVVLELTM